MNAKILVLAICVEAIIYLLQYNLHDCTFNVLGFWTVEHHCSLSPLYSTWNKEIHAIHWAVFIKTLRLALISDYWNLVWFPIVGNHSNFRKRWFHAKKSHKRFVETSFKEVNVCFVLGRVVANYRHAICKKSCWKVSYCYWWLYLHVALFRMHVPLDGTHLVAVRGLIHQEVPTRVHQREELNWASQLKSSDQQISSTMSRPESKLIRQD